MPVARSSLKNTSALPCQTWSMSGSTISGRAQSQPRRHSGFMWWESKFSRRRFRSAHRFESLAHPDVLSAQLNQCRGGAGERAVAAVFLNRAREHLHP